MGVLLGQVPYLTVLFISSSSNNLCVCVCVEKLVVVLVTLILGSGLIEDVH